MWWKNALWSGLLRPLNLSPLWFVACSAAAGPGAGEERGVCGPEVACAAGLECWSERCVRPPPADCRKVGERLAGRVLDNYTPREQREGEVKKWEEACLRERLSKAEGACIETAAGDREIAMCPRPLVPELVGDAPGCAAIGKQVKYLIEQGVSGDLSPIVNVIDDVPDVVKQLCVEGRWSQSMKSCLNNVGNIEAAERCVDLLDRAQQKAVERALRTLVLKGKNEPRDPWR